MSNTFPDDTFLARWLNGELTEQEQNALKKRKDYEALRQIIEGSEALQLPAFSEEASWEKLLTTRNQPKETAVRPLRRWRIYGAAASIALLAIFSFLFFQSQRSFQTRAGEQRALTLPDGSTVMLNAESEVAFNTLSWRIKRSVHLDGEGFFEVKKGRNFKVNTPNGQVQVLGTSFNVWSRKGQFQVDCQGFEDASGLVGGSVVDRDHLEVDPFLFEEPAHRGLDTLLLVTGSNHDRHSRVATVGRSTLGKARDVRNVVDAARREGEPEQRDETETEDHRRSW